MSRSIRAQCSASARGFASIVPRSLSRNGARNMPTKRHGFHGSASMRAFHRGVNQSPNEPRRIDGGNALATFATYSPLRYE